MYANITYEIILKRMLDRIPDNIDKREGSVIYDALAPTAVEIQNLYIELDSVLNESFADTASLPYLIRKCAERGITRLPATKAVLKAVTTPISLELPIGARFSLNELNYTVTEKITDGEYKLECETSGSIGNSYFGDIIPIDYIMGLETIKITELLIPGEDAEDVEILRERYFQSISSQSFGGNVTDYIEKINSINGVGGVKIYRAWNGGGKVKAVIINSEYSKPSETLVEAVQHEIDPVESQGEGLGIAPIGHIVTITGCGEVPIDIETTIKFEPNWDWEKLKTYAETAIDDYFKELAEGWEEADKNDLIVRISQIETRLLDLEGVLDISDTRLNDNASNLSIDKDSIPIRGSVTNVCKKID